MTASTRSTTDAAEQIVEAALALGPQIRAAVDEMEQGRYAMVNSASASSVGQ